MSTVDGGSPGDAMRREDYLEQAKRAERLGNAVFTQIDKQRLLDAAEEWRRKAEETKAEIEVSRKLPENSDSFSRRTR
jgi:hypothetical protein